MKFFDSLDWLYLLHIVRVMGFQERILRWVAHCVTSPYFFMMTNGSFGGYFPGNKGLQQGDRPSPYFCVWYGISKV